MFTHGSLFSGIGGFDLAAKWMGWHNAFHCEINEFCTKILNYHFQDAEHYTEEGRKRKGIRQRHCATNSL